MRPAGDFAILGPTASGKTALAIELARRDAGIELVSVDAFACYRRLDIGTAKPDATARQAATWHLLDLVEPTEAFSVAEFARAARTARQAIAGRARAGLVGGSGLYLRALVDGLDPPPRYPALAAELEALVAEPGGAARLHERLAGLDPLGASRMEPSNARRVLRALEVTLGSGRPFSSFGPGLTVYPPSPVELIGLELSKAELDRRLAARLVAELEAGFLDELASLLAEGIELSRTASQAIGYRELTAVVEGRATLEAASEEVLRRSRTLARRQIAWLRRDPRIVWVDATRPDLADHVAALLDRAAGRPGASARGRADPV